MEDDVKLSAIEELSAVNVLKAFVDDIYKLKETSPKLFTVPLTDEDGTYFPCDRIIAQTKKKISELKDKALGEDRAKYWYLCGKMYMASPTYTSDAVECLSRSVKLDPCSIESWNDLGESYWHSQNYKMAKSCFLGALRQEKNKISLRNLSMVLRKMPASSAQEHVDNIRSGVTYAKDAVELDPSDGTSWAILGNAYLAAFFTFKEQFCSITQALGAYKQAEKHPSTKQNQELFYNKGVALKYEENYLLALEAFSFALTIDPDWSLAEEQVKTLIEYLDTIQKNDQNRGKLSAKRIKSMIDGLRKPSLGLYSSSKNYTEISIGSLENGPNKNKIIVGKVLWSLQLDGSFPFTFGMMDRSKVTGVVTVYNMAPGKGVLIGDSVAIPDPVFEKVDFFYNSKEYNFSKIRLNEPISLIINNKSPPRDFKGFSSVSFKDVC